MYAFIESGGKQYRVQEGDVLDVERLSHDKTVTFDKVLVVHDGKTPKVGLPYVPKCTVEAQVIGEAKGPKVIAYKYKKRKKSRRLVGHRQKYTRVKISKIAIG